MSNEKFKEFMDDIFVPKKGASIKKGLIQDAYREYFGSGINYTKFNAFLKKNYMVNNMYLKNFEFKNDDDNIISIGDNDIKEDLENNMLIKINNVVEYLKDTIENSKDIIDDSDKDKFDAICGSFEEELDNYEKIKRDLVKILGRFTVLKNNICSMEINLSE